MEILSNWIMTWIFNQLDTLQFFIRCLKPSYLPVIWPYLGNNPFVPAHLDPQPTIGSGEQLVAQSGRRKENPRGVWHVLSLGVCLILFCENHLIFDFSGNFAWFKFALLAVFS